VVRNCTSTMGREDCWIIGIRHRERLLRDYMVSNGLTVRPFLKDVIDDLIEEVQGARLREEVLPLDRFAQTEMVDGRAIVSVNTRVDHVPGVKDVAGIVYVSKWHESIHVDRDFDDDASDIPLGGARPASRVQSSRLIVCRSTGVRRGIVPRWEFVAENAAIAAAIAGPDLARSRAFFKFQRLAAGRGDLGSGGWTLVYEISKDIGVNTAALLRYFGHLNICQVIDEGNRRRLYAPPGPFKELEWWRPDCELIKCDS
jgi:hypothetical protein